MNLIKWDRPSGVPLETNDRKETIEYCESLGYTREGAKPEANGNTDKEDRDALEAYVLKEFGVDLDKRGSLETVKAKVKVIEDEHRN